jgi:hypothetical protein
MEIMSSELGQFTGGIVGFLVLLIDIICIVEIVNSRKDLVKKLAWGALIFLFPILGALVYALFGRGNVNAGYQAIV